MPNDDFATPDAETTKMTDALYDRQPLTPEPGKFYAHVPVDAAFEQREAELAAVGIDTAARAQLRDTVRSATKDLPDAVAIAIADGHADALLRAAGVHEADVDQAARNQRIIDGNKACREALNDTYRVKDGEELLGRVQRYVLRTPALAKILRETGLGAKPEIVSAIAAHVFSQGIR